MLVKKNIKSQNFFSQQKNLCETKKNLSQKILVKKKFQSHNFFSHKEILVPKKI